MTTNRRFTNSFYQGTQIRKIEDIKQRRLDFIVRCTKKLDKEIRKKEPDMVTINFVTRFREELRNKIKEM